MAVDRGGEGCDIGKPRYLTTACTSRSLLWPPGGQTPRPPPPGPPRPEADRSRSLVKRGVSPKNELYQQGHKGHEHAISLQ